MNDIRDGAELDRPFINQTKRVADFFREDPEPFEHRWDAGFPKQGMVMFYGASGLGKTAFLLHLMICIAAGIDCLGHKTERCVVYYFVGEGAAGIPQRVRAIMESLGLHWADLDDWLFIRVVPTDVSDFATRVQFARELHAHGVHQSPGLLVFDTATAHAPSGYDENSTRDATAILSAYRSLGTEYDATVLLVTHTGHANGPASERMRGSSAFFAAADVTLKLSKLGEVTRALSWEKARDFAPPQPLKFTMKPKFDGLVIEAVEVAAADDEGITPMDRAALTALALRYEGAPVRAKEWERAASGLGLSKSHFYRVRAKLEQGKLVLQSGKGYVLTIGGQKIVDEITRSSEPQIFTAQSHRSHSGPITKMRPAQTVPLVSRSLERDHGTSARGKTVQSHFGPASVSETNAGPSLTDDGYFQSLTQDGVT